MAVTFNERSATAYAAGYERLQRRFSGRIEIVETESTAEHLDPAQLRSGRTAGAERKAGFSDISAPAGQLGPLIGRVILYPNRRSQQYQPAVITGGHSLQLTVLDQPYDPRAGVTDGILFGLGLKNDTRQPGFGSHTAARGFEAGHVAPSMIAVRADSVRRDILSRGDLGTHAVGSELGGIPEKMVAENLLGAVSLKTVTLDRNNPRPVPLAWHDSLEGDEGVMLARYTGPTSAVELMLGAASSQLGDRLIDELGGMAEAAVGRA